MRQRTCPISYGAEWLIRRAILALGSGEADLDALTRLGEGVVRQADVRRLAPLADEVGVDLRWLLDY
jgi:hypothetical protein